MKPTYGAYLEVRETYSKNERGRQLRRIGARSVVLKTGEAHHVETSNRVCVGTGLGRGQRARYQV